MTFLIIKSLFAFSHRIGTPYPSEKCGMVKLDGAIRSTLIRCSRSMLSDSQGGFVQSRHTLCLVGCLYRLANSFSLWEFRWWERRDRRPEHRLPLTFLLETSSSSSPSQPSSSYCKYDENERCLSSFLMFHRFESSLLLFQREHDKSEKRLGFINFRYIYKRKRRW